MDLPTRQFSFDTVLNYDLSISQAEIKTRPLEDEGMIDEIVEVITVQYENFQSPQWQGRDIKTDIFSRILDWKHYLFCLDYVFK